MRIRFVSQKNLVSLSLAAILALLSATVYFWLFLKDADPKASKGSSSKKQTSSNVDLIPVGVASKNTVRSFSREKNATSAVPSQMSSSSGAKNLERWEAIARASRPSLLSGPTLSLRPAIISLLELTPSQVNDINSEIKSWMARLQAEEVKHGYVLVKKDGSEWVVVAPFDRGPLLTEFQTAVAARNGHEIGKFLSGQMQFDSNCAVENREMSVHIEKGSDGNELIVFRRETKSRDPRNGPGQYRPGEVGLWVDKYHPGEGYAVRYQHLLDAAGSLPRQTE